MQSNALAERKDDASTTDDAETCGCSALMPCFRCFHAGERGRPAVRRVA